MNTIQNNNNINFTSVMKFEGFAKDKNKLKKVAKLFEQKTKDYNDEFVLKNKNKEVIVLHNDYQDTGIEREYRIPKIVWNSLIEYGDLTITSKFTKLLKIGRRANYENKVAAKYMDSVLARNKYGDPTNFESKFWLAFLDKNRTFVKDSMSQDRFLKLFEM